MLPAPDPASPSGSAASPVQDATGQGTEPVKATAASTHDMFVAVGILGAFVYLMVILAGTSKNAGKFVVFLFVALIILQGIGHVGPFATFAKKHPLSPSRK